VGRGLVNGKGKLTKKAIFPEGKGPGRGGKKSLISEPSRRTSHEKGKPEGRVTQSRNIRAVFEPGLSKTRRERKIIYMSQGRRTLY